MQVQQTPTHIATVSVQPYSAHVVCIDPSLDFARKYYGEGSVDLMNVRPFDFDLLAEWEREDYDTTKDGICEALALCAANGMMDELARLVATFPCLPEDCLQVACDTAIEYDQPPTLSWLLLYGVTPSHDVLDDLRDDARSEAPATLEADAPPHVRPLLELFVRTHPECGLAKHLLQQRFLVAA